MKKIYHITPQQTKSIISESLSDPELMKMVGQKNDRNAYPEPVSAGLSDEVGVGIKEEKPEPDLKSLPKPPEIKEAWKLLRQASSLLVQGAPKLQDETLTKEVQKLAHDINGLIMGTNAKLNVNETDLSI